MNLNEYDRMFELEDKYWWFVGRRFLAVTLFKRLGNLHGKVLDLGCGTGAVLAEFSNLTESVGLDMSMVALKFASSRKDFNLVQASGTDMPFGAETFDSVVGLDVFEHIENHEAAFKECYRVLRPGGKLILSVPAFKMLWGPHDVALHHFRRYRKSEVVDIITASGFEPVKVSYSLFFLYPVVLVVRFFEKRRRGQVAASLPKLWTPLNGLLINLQAMEAHIISKINLPWGSSVVAIALKPMK